MSEISLSEYIAQATRGLYQSLIGPNQLSKAYFTVDTASGIFNTTYGNKVWHALNNQTRIFNALPRVVWGRTAGWRIRTDRGDGRSRPVTETGSLPTVDVSNIANVSSLPRIVATTFGASVKAIFTAQLEGGVGDVLAMEMENAQIDHVKEINEEILAGGEYIVSGGSTTTFVVPAAVDQHFKIGDTVMIWDNSANNWIDTSGLAVSAISNGTVTIATASAAVADNDIVAIHGRAGFTSLFDVVSENGQRAGGGSTNANFTANGGVRAYDLTVTGTGRAAGSWNAGAYVGYNAGVERDLTLNLIDNAIQNIRQNGGEPKLIVMGHDQYFKLERLLNTQQRYMGSEEYQVGVGNERTFPGTRTGMVLATYQNVPILTEPDCPQAVSVANDTVVGRDVFVLDTDYLEIAIAQPTQYIENRDYFANNSMQVRGLFYTMGEMRTRNIWVQARISDLTP